MMEWTPAIGLEGLHLALEKRLNQSEDPRVGSSRDNSTGGTLSHATSSGTNSSSASSLGSTFIPVAIYAAVCLSIFFVFRRKCRRVYAPRSMAAIRRSPYTPVDELPDTWFSWIKVFYNLDDTYLLNNISLDGFLFLRYIRVLATICFAGVVIAWPVLLSVNATGGNNLEQLNLLTIGDVAEPVRFYAHALIAWIYFGFILIMISRECIYYINLRQAYLMTPAHMHRLSSRTVLFTCVPDRFLDEARVRKLFGDAVKNVWIPRNTRQLERLVNEREKTAIRLEKAEIELIRLANLERQRQEAAGAKGHILSALPFFGRTNKAADAEADAEAAAEAAGPAPPTRTNTAGSVASSPPRTPRTPQTATSNLSPSSPLSHTTTAVARAATDSSSLRRTSAASHNGTNGTPAHVLSNTLAPSPTAETRDISGLAGPHHGLGISNNATGSSNDRHGSVSDAGSGPTAVGSSNASPMFDMAVIASPTMTVATSVDDEKDDTSDKLRVDDGITKETSALGSNTDETGETGETGKKDCDVQDAVDDDDESHYVHPYGYAPNLPDVRGSVAAQWLPAEKRPAHRPIANFGRRVDTIRWTRQRIKALNIDIAKMRRQFRAGHGEPLSSMFVEFDTQAAAQVAYQVLTHHQPLHMGPRFIGIRPQDVIWSSLRMRWWERIIRRFLMMGVIAMGVVFWSFPAALVGIVSNLSYLTETFVFLKWINYIPSTILGVIQGLLPATALSLLMAAVPGMLRICARTAGITSEPMVELYVQNAYFCFEIVQVFLITTLTSAASAALTKILQDPLSIKDLLSENLPKSSNFYLSYITVQCLAGGALGMVHFFDLFRHGLLNKTIKHPRRAVRNFQRLRAPHWGGIFPVYTNMGVIAISYTCIAPLILIFAGIGMLVIFNVYKYNLLYAYDNDRDSKGLHYPRGLMQLLAGLYLAQVCLIGLFSIQSAIGPVVMMIMMLVFTFLVHMSLDDAVTPLLYNLPRTLALEDKDLAKGHEDLREDAKKEAEEAAAAAMPAAADDAAGGLNADYYNMEEGLGASSSDNVIDANHASPNTSSGHHEDDFSDPEDAYGQEDPDDQLHNGPVSNRGLAGVDGASDLFGLVRDWGRDALRNRVKADVQAFKADAKSATQLVPTVNLDRVKVDPARVERMPKWLRKVFPKALTRQPAAATKELGANFLQRWLQPQVYEDYTYLRKMMPVDEEPTEYPKDYWRRGYWPPEMWRPIPTLWIPRDASRVSRQEVAHTRAVLPITDKGAWLTAKGNVMADMEAAPFLEPIYIY